MTPYATFLYFGVLLYSVLPTILMGLIGRVPWRWVVLVTAAMLVVQYWGTVSPLPGTAFQEVWLVVGYGVFEWIVASGFLWARSRTKNRALFWVALLLALLPLALAKFVPLFKPGYLVGFVGLSYITFRALDVVISIQDRLVPSLSIVQYLGYLLFFPTISSGPIDRYRRFVGDWGHRRNRTEFLQDLDGAVHRIFTGFLYKFIVAALIKQHWLDPAAGGSDLLSTLSYMYAYSFYLFFDFAGYSAFAIGLSYLFGIHSPENFDRPFLARDIRDFWNRWHMSLSFWFRDHIYTRFVFAATKGRWFKSRYLGSHFGYFLTFGFMGLWHGTQAYYLLYGLYHAGLFVGLDSFSRWNRRHRVWGEGPIWTAAGVFVTFNLVCFGFLLFSGHIGPGAGS
jgi:membrane protein involved in D-alanine export